MNQLNIFIIILFQVQKNKIKVTNSMYLYETLNIYNKFLSFILKFSIIHWEISKWNIIYHRKV